MTNFRKQAIAEFDLDPSNYLTLPAFCHDAMLRHTKAELGLISDITLYNMVETNLRGGQAQVNRRYSKANHSYLPNYDSEKQFKVIEYDDLNQAYAHCMNTSIPMNLRWTSPEEHQWITREIEEFRMANIRADDSHGFIVEVTIGYPHSAKKRFRNFPPLPIKSEVQLNNLSLHTRELLDQFQQGNELGSKLISDLHDHKVALHCEYLQCLLLVGLEVKYVHRSCIFQQANWMAPFIDHHVTLRRQAKTDYQKSFHKLVLNAQFGEFICIYILAICDINVPIYYQPTTYQLPTNLPTYLPTYLPFMQENYWRI